MQALGLVWDDPLTPNQSETVSPIPSPKHSGARQLFGYWRDLQESGGLVVSRDLPSRHLSGILRNLAIFEPIDRSRDFRTRLAGTAFLRRFGRDITGLKLSEIFRESRFETHRDSMAEISRTRVPQSLEAKVQRGNRTLFEFEVLRLPVFAPDCCHIWILSGLFFSD